MQSTDQIKVVCGGVLMGMGGIKRGFRELHTAHALMGGMVQASNVSHQSIVYRQDDICLIKHRVCASNLNFSINHTVSSFCIVHVQAARLWPWLLPQADSSFPRQAGQLVQVNIVVPVLPAQLHQMASQW